MKRTFYINDKKHTLELNDHLVVTLDKTEIGTFHTDGTNICVSFRFDTDICYEDISYLVEYIEDHFERFQPYLRMNEKSIVASLRQKLRGTEFKLVNYRYNERHDHPVFWATLKTKSLSIKFEISRTYDYSSGEPTTYFHICEDSCSMDIGITDFVNRDLLDF